MGYEILLFLLAIAPGIAISFYIFRVDKYERESRRHLLLCFAMGIAVTFPAILLETMAIDYGLNSTYGWVDTLIYAFFGIALIEETVKVIAIFIHPFFRQRFNEPMDGIVYSVMIGMGFATLENVMYAFNNGIETALVRAFTAVPAHALFAVISGYYIGLAKFDLQNRWILILKGLGLAIFVHAIYDFFLLQQMYEWLSAFAILTLFISYQFAKQMIRLHWNTSPHKSVVATTEEIEIKIDWNLTEKTDAEIEDLLNRYDEEVDDRE